jgi:PTS system mannose-specific IID component
MNLRQQPPPGRAAAPSLAGLFLRSHLLQAGWNFQRMQNLGFLFSIQPALDRIWKDPEERSRAALRHLEYFNTQPYMSGFCLGSVARLEEGLAGTPAADRPALEERLRAFKAAGASTCAALGDSFFWATLRPACALLAVLMWGLGAFTLWSRAFLNGEAPAALPAWVFLAGSAAYLIVFNAVSQSIRWIGIKRGYVLGENVARKLKRLPLRLWDARVRIASFTVAAVGTTGFLCLVVAHRQFWLLILAAVYGTLKMFRFSNIALYASTLCAACAAAWIHL